MLSNTLLNTLYKWLPCIRYLQKMMLKWTVKHLQLFLKLKK